jgi:hypothetical protein
MKMFRQLTSLSLTTICKDCGEKFTLSEQEIRFYRGNKMSLPKRCYSCREKRRRDNKVDLKDMIGKFVTRTKPSWNGDRSFLGEKIKINSINSDGSILYQYPKGTLFDDRIYEMSPQNNDGYWKEVKDENKTDEEVLTEIVNEVKLEDTITYKILQYSEDNDLTTTQKLLNTLIDVNKFLEKKGYGFLSNEISNLIKTL